jgi:hypothetical protein
VVSCRSRAPYAGCTGGSTKRTEIPDFFLSVSVGSAKAFSIFHQGPPKTGRPTDISSLYLCLDFCFFINISSLLYLLNFVSSTIV